MWFLIGCCGLLSRLFRKKESIRTRSLTAESASGNLDNDKSNINLVIDESNKTFTFEPGFYYSIEMRYNSDFLTILDSEFVLATSPKAVELIAASCYEKFCDDEKEKLLDNLKNILNIFLDRENLKDDDLLNQDNYELYHEEIIKRKNEGGIVITEHKTILKYKPLNYCISGVNGRYTLYENANSVANKISDSYDISNYFRDLCKRYSIAHANAGHCRRINGEEVIYINRADPEIYIFKERTFNMQAFNKTYTVNCPINANKYIENPDQTSSEKFILVSSIKKNKETLIKNTGLIPYKLSKYSIRQSSCITYIILKIFP